MRKCPSCDAWNNDDEIQCRNCHDWLEIIPTRKKQETDSKISFQKILKTYGVVIILTVIIIVAFLFKVSQKEDTPKKSGQDAEITAPLVEDVSPGPGVNSTVKVTPNPARELIAKAKTLCSPDGECPQEAIEYLTEAIRLQPDNRYAYLLRGGAYYKLKRDELAVEDFSEAIRLEPDNAHTYTLRGFAYAYLNEYDLAIRDFDKAISLKPETASYYQGRGHIYMLAKNMEEGCLSFQQACEFGACEALRNQQQQGHCPDE